MKNINLFFSGYTFYSLTFIIAGEGADMEKARSTRIPLSKASH
jgi:hypothetical protein